MVEKSMIVVETKDILDSIEGVKMIYVIDIMRDNSVALFQTATKLLENLKSMQS